MLLAHRAAAAPSSGIQPSKPPSVCLCLSMKCPEIRLMSCEPNDSVRARVLAHCHTQEQPGSENRENKYSAHSVAHTLLAIHAKDTVCAESRVGRSTRAAQHTHRTARFVRSLSVYPSCTEQLFSLFIHVYFSLLCGSKVYIEAVTSGAEKH